MLNSVHTKVCITSLDKLLDKVSPFLEDIAEKLDTSLERDVQVLDSTLYQTTDFWFPEYQIGIDVNDWIHHQHSRPPVDFDKLSRANYHRDKVLAALKQDIKHIILWQNWVEDENKWAVLQNIIMHSFKLHNKENSTTVYGRNTEVRFIDRNSDDTKAFLNKNALFGHHGGSHSVGLFDKKTGELLMVMTNRYKKDTGVLLCERMAAKQGYNIPGGVSKIIKFVERNVCFSSWTFFIVLDYGYGYGLEAAGFTPTKVQTVLMQYQVADDVALSRGRGSYREFMDNIANGVEARIYLAGTRKFVKDNPTNHSACSLGNCTHGFQDAVTKDKVKQVK